MELTLLPSPNDDVVLVRSRGPISVPDANDPLQQVAGPHCYTYKVLLFLNDSQKIDTSGVCWLANSSKRFTDEGGMLVLIAVSPVVHDMLDFLRLVPLLNIAPNEQAARKLASARANNNSDDKRSMRSALPPTGDIIPM